MSDELLEQLLGEEPEKPKTLNEQREVNMAASGRAKVSAKNLRFPVTMNWIADFLDVDKSVVKRRLAKVKPHAYGGTGANKRPLFIIPDVLPYLIKSEMDTITVIESTHPNDLPPFINKAFWDAKNARLKYELEAGRVFDGDDCLSLFADVHKTLADTFRMWRVQLVRETQGKTADDFLQVLDGLIKTLIDDLFQKLINKPNERVTQSIFDKEKEEFAPQSFEE